MAFVGQTGSQRRQGRHFSLGTASATSLGYCSSSLKSLTFSVVLSAALSVNTIPQAFSSSLHRSKHSGPFGHGHIFVFDLSRWQFLFHSHPEGPNRAEVGAHAAEDTSVQV